MGVLPILYAGMAPNVIGANLGLVDRTAWNSAPASVQTCL